MYLTWLHEELVPVGLRRSVSQFCHSKSSSSISMGVGGSSTSGGTNDAAGGGGGMSLTRLTIFHTHDTISQVPLSRFTMSRSGYCRCSVPSISVMVVSVRGCLDRVLVAISQISYEK